MASVSTFMISVLLVVTQFKVPSHLAALARGWGFGINCFKTANVQNIEPMRGEGDVGSRVGLTREGWPTGPSLVGT